jgi:hypothetical protein
MGILHTVLSMLIDTLSFFSAHFHSGILNLFVRPVPVDGRTSERRIVVDLFDSNAFQQNRGLFSRNVRSTYGV